jgi:hypothetical protein
MQVKDLVVTGDVVVLGEIKSEQVDDKAPMYIYSTTDIGEGASLPTGVLYFVYD